MKITSKSLFNVRNLLIISALCFFEPTFSQDAELCNTSEKPVDEPPISLVELLALSSQPSFYDSTHRYTDRLGTRGGRYSAGFFDTWLGETQIFFPYDQLPVRVNLTDTQIVANDSNYMYWMTLAMGQEYFNVDMQWMMGVGAKETFSGTPWAGPPFNTNDEGAYGPFEVEIFTGVDRAIGYPDLFPEYDAQLRAAQDAASSGIPPTDFMNHYIGANPTPLDGPQVVNGYVMSASNFFTIYNWYSYAEDLCWHKVIDEPADEFYGVAAMTVTYNLGVFAADPIADTMDSDSHASTHADPNARDLLPTGNSNYRIHITEVIENIVARADAAANDNNAPLWDYQIEWPMVERFFLGEGGTVATQGAGGLLRHYEVADTAVRQQIMSTLMQAFDILEGRAPSSNANSISFRYDWLSLLRTVKQHFPNDFLFEAPTRGDGSLRINSYSNQGGCCTDPEIEVDQRCLDEDTSFNLDETVDAVSWRILDNMGTTIFTSSNPDDSYVFTQSGEYTIEASVTLGTETEIITRNLVFDSDKPDASNISDYVLCYETGTNAVFDLTTKTAGIVAANQGFSDLDVTYHLTEQDADNRENEVQNAMAYSFTGTEQEVFVAVSANSSNCISTGSFNLIKNEVDLNIEAQYEVSCDTLSIELDGFDSYLWRNLDTGDTISTTATVAIAQAGNYDIAVESQFMGESCTVTKTFTVVDESALDPQNYTARYEGNSIIVEVLDDSSSNEFALDDSNGAYSPTARFDNVDSLVPHTIHIRNQQGCATSITLSPETPSSGLVIPKFFTPNGDGSNDTWRITDNNNVLSSTSIVFIFDRYGKLLSQENPLNPGWNGRFNNQEMPSTDYWFLLEYDTDTNRKMKIQGHFSLKR